MFVVKEKKIKNVILILFLGFLWHEIKQGYTDGLKDYLLSWNNIVDSCMNILYLSSFALKYYVFIKVKDKEIKFQIEIFFLNI